MMLVAQSSQRPLGQDRQRERGSIISLPTGTEDVIAKTRAVPMEGAIDPATYTLGPSDVLLVALWGPLSFAQQLTVTPEGTLIIPTVGELKVAGMSLADTKVEVSRVVRKKYIAGEVSVTLMSPREFVVRLRGAVLREGEYVVSAVDRVEKVLVEGAGLEPLRATMTVSPLDGKTGDPLGPEEVRAPSYRGIARVDDRASLRNIRLIRRTGDTLRVDIPRFYVTHEDRYNPFLLDGDIVVVPQRNLTRNFVTVDGAVHAPGRYEYVEGDELLTLLEIAQWFTVAADRKNVVILRLDETGNVAEEIVVDVDRVKNGELPNPAIQRGDRIVVKARPDDRKNYAVIVSGAVRNPGQYPIGRTSTRLSKIIRDAGGFSDDALLTGSVVLRKEERLEGLVDARMDLARVQRTHQLTGPDTTYFLLDYELGRSPVVVDFVRLFEHRDSLHDVTLRDRDIVHIASNQQTVLVQGQVANPGHIAYVPDMGYRYYVDRAGGYSERAETGDVKVIKQGSLEWVDPDKTAIEPGDKIWVPKMPYREFRYYVEIVRDVFGVVAGVATLVILAITVTR